MKKLTTEEFIEKARKIHGDKYDYSKVDYKNNKTKITIICSKHGEFQQTPSDHLFGAGCPKCPKNRGLSAEEFLKKAREVHGDKYDYSKVEYNCKSTVVCIICPKHGEFFKTPKRFLSGPGCDKCLKEESKSKHKKRLTPRYWTKERCYEEAKKYTNREQFNRCSSAAYHSALNHSWLDDYTWFKKPFLWTEKLCYKEAKKYTSKRDFEKNCSGGYSAAFRNKWLDNYIWLKPDPHEGRIDNVYMYFFEESNSIYVGRTIDVKSRDLEHRRKEGKSSVRLFSEENNVSIPPIKILESNLTVEEGAEREKYWLDYYKDSGFNIINRAPAGSLGNPGPRKWNKESCYNEAKKYSTLAEFNKKRGKCYEVAKKNNWLKDYTWLKGRFRWTKELCRKEALKYTELAKFRRYSSGCFQAATKNGWISEYTWLKKPFKWTKELYLEKAKECKDLGDLKKKFPNCYKAALWHKWSGGFRDE